MSFHGGLLGVIASMLWFAHSRKRPWMQVADFVALCVPRPGGGRVGNFINGELWGAFASPDLPWGMVFAQRFFAATASFRRFTSFCSKALLLFVLLWLYARRERRRARWPLRSWWVWRAAFHRRVFSRARQLFRAVVPGHEHGPVAVPAMILAGAGMWLYCGRSAAR